MQKPIKAFRVKDLFFQAASLLFVAFVLLYPARCIGAAKDGLNLSLYMVLPSLFPFMVISTYITETLELPEWMTKPVSRFLNLSPAASVPFLLGLISGYPTGAVLAAASVRKKSISAEEASYLLPFCNAGGPLFIVGVAGGGMLGSFQIGYFLYTVHLISIFIACLLLRKNAPKAFSHTSAPAAKQSGAFLSAVDKGVHSMLNVMGMIIFFSVVCEIFKISGLLNRLPCPPLFLGLIELTSGMNQIALSELSLRLKISLCAALIGFSGLCIFMQASLAVKGTFIRLNRYIWGKCLIAALSFAIAYFAFPYLPLPKETFAMQSTAPFSSPYLAVSYIFIITLSVLCRSAKRIKGTFFDNRD